MITEEEVERAIYYLRDSAPEYGRLKGRARALAFRLKVTESDEFLQVQGGSVEHRKAVARSSNSYKNLVEEYENTEIEALTIEAKRESCLQLISYYQSRIKAHGQGLYL